MSTIRCPACGAANKGRTTCGACDVPLGPREIRPNPLMALAQERDQTLHAIVVEACGFYGAVDGEQIADRVLELLRRRRMRSG